MLNKLNEKCEQNKKEFYKALNISFPQPSCGSEIKGKGKGKGLGGKDGKTCVPIKKSAPAPKDGSFKPNDSEEEVPISKGTPAPSDGLFCTIDESKVPNAVLTTQWLDQPGPTVEKAAGVEITPKEYDNRDNKTMKKFIKWTKEQNHAQIIMIFLKFFQKNSRNNIR